MRTGYVDVKSEEAILEASREQNAWHRGSRHFQRAGNFVVVGLDNFVALLQMDKMEKQHSVGHLEEEEEGKLQAHRFQLTLHHARSLREQLTYF